MNYAILINTCDKFDDCWEAFFKLWSIYWKDCKGEIYLNTEYKKYTFPSIDIKSIQGCKKNGIPLSTRATWSQCLNWALEEIENDIVLYMQEDYFLKDTVKNEIVERYVKLMEDNPDIHCIHLTDQAVITEGESTKFKGLLTVKLNQRYRLGCQAALWRKDVLRKHIKPYESAWEFEEFGSERSAVMAHNFYCVDTNVVKLNEFEIIPYIFTGIVQGKWYEEVIPLFDKHHISVDYSQRGFLKERVEKPLIKRIQYRLEKIPKIIRHRSALKQVKPYNSK